jgi:hypothetical protein
MPSDASRRDHDNLSPSFLQDDRCDCDTREEKIATAKDEEITCHIGQSLMNAVIARSARKISVGADGGIDQTSG